MPQTKPVSRERIMRLTYTAVMAVIIAICAWITIPGVVPFTLQTFGVFVAVGILGGKFGTLAVLLYVLLGAIGIPVFSGFSGGIGILLGNTGGYIVGFIFSALAYWLITKLLGKKTWVMAVSMVIGLILCYAFGTVWFMNVYAKANGPIALATTLSWCVTPFIVPDLIKIACALGLTKVLKRVIKNLDIFE